MDSPVQTGQEERRGAEEEPLPMDDMHTVSDMLENYTIPQLRAVMTLVEGLIEQQEAREREEKERVEREEREARAAKIEAVRRTIGEYGFTANDLFPEVSEQKSARQGHKRKSAQKDYQKSHKRNPAFPVKFRGPNGEVWAGNGRVPKWIRQLEAEGHTREEYAVAGD